MEKVFAYLRVSSPGQAKNDKDGFTRQEKAIRDYAKANGLEVAAVFKEDFTGTEEARPELAKLMISLEQNNHGVKTVIIEKLDRLARDLMVQEAIIRDFQKEGFDLISVHEGPDLASDDATRKLVRQVLGAIAEYDKTMTVFKLRAARDRISTRKGSRVEGRKGYGETPEEQAVIRKMRAYRRPRKGRKGKTYRQIADILNEQGFRTKEGKLWVGAKVHQILNPKK